MCRNPNPTPSPSPTPTPTPTDSARTSQGTLARHIDSDDPLGRVVVPLGRLASDTVYDSWYFVQYKNTRRHAGSRGSLRIRLSVHYPSERARLLAEANPVPSH